MHKIQYVLALFLVLIAAHCTAPKHTESTPVTSQKPINTTATENMNGNTTPQETFFKRLFTENETTLGLCRVK